MYELPEEEHSNTTRQQSRHSSGRHTILIQQYENTTHNHKTDSWSHGSTRLDLAYDIHPLLTTTTTMTRDDYELMARWHELKTTGKKLNKQISELKRLATENDDHIYTIKQHFRNAMQVGDIWSGNSIEYEINPKLKLQYYVQKTHNNVMLDTRELAF